MFLSTIQIKCTLDYAHHLVTNMGNFQMKKLERCEGKGKGRMPHNMRIQRPGLTDVLTDSSRKRRQTTNGCFAERPNYQNNPQRTTFTITSCLREKGMVSKHRLLDSKLGQIMETRGTAVPGYPEQTSQY